MIIKLNLLFFEVVVVVVVVVPRTCGKPYPYPSKSGGYAMLMSPINIRAKQLFMAVTAQVDGNALA